MTEEEKITIGQRVRAAREAKDMTQLQVAEGICSDGTVSQLERGQLIPSGKILRGICKNLGITTKDLFAGYEQNMEVDTLLEIIKIHIEKGEFDDAFHLIGSLKAREEMAEYQTRTLTLSEAIAKIKSGKSEEAIGPLKGLLQNLDETNETDHHLMARVLNQLGNAYFHQHQLVEAYHYYKQAYRTSHKFPEFELLAADITFNLGNICTWLGNVSEALAYVSIAKNYFEKISDTTGLADTLFSLGLTYHSLGEWDNSKVSLQQSLALYESANMLRTAERVKYAYASLILRQTAPREALQTYLRSANEYIQHQDRSRLVYTYGLIAITYLDLSEHDQAKVYLDMAMKLVEEEPDKAQVDPRYMYAYRAYGVYLLHTKNYESALSYSTEAAKFYDMIGLQKDAVECLKTCMAIYEETGRKDDVIDVSKEIIKRLEPSRESFYFRQEV